MEELKERLKKQLDILEKAQEQAINDGEYEPVAKLSAQYLAIVALLADM